MSWAHAEDLKCNLGIGGWQEECALFTNMLMVAFVSEALKKQVRNYNTHHILENVDICVAG